MPWNATLHPEMPIIIASYSGTVLAPELIDAFNAIVKLANQHKIYNVLGDCTELAAGGHSLVDLYFLASVLEANAIARQLKEAVLLPILPDSVSNVRYWEDTCRARGLNIRLFDDQESAVSWLLADD
jgi:hypothetical protein